MIFLQAEASNFGSYKRIQFRFDKLGLSLLTGTTGAGKSTLQDLIPWILFGITAKGGNVDEVRTWASDESTAGSLDVILSDNSTIKVIRVRGKPSQNDLHWCESGSSTPKRGKDLLDTQKLLNDRLGITSSTYITSAYFNEFSPTSTFFLDKKSTRRELFESLVDLSFPMKLQEKTANEKKALIKVQADTSMDLAYCSGSLRTLKNNLSKQEKQNSDFDVNRQLRINRLQQQSFAFAEEKSQRLDEVKVKIDIFEEKKNKDIQKLELIKNTLKAQLSENKEHCESCGQRDKTYQETYIKLVQIDNKLVSVGREKNPYISEFDRISDSSDTYLEQIQSLEQEISPYLSQIHSTLCDIVNKEQNLIDIENQIKELDIKILTLTQLNKLSGDLRGLLLTRTIQQIEDQTNYYLSTYFEGEIRATLILSGDSLDVSLQKNSHLCVYTQLSRGQRSMLRLSFATSVMKAAANRAGVHFSALFFDEVLDGLSSELKIKSLGIFQELEKEHNTIMVIDHATEIQSHFDRRFQVTLVADESKIEEI